MSGAFGRNAPRRKRPKQNKTSTNRTKASPNRPGAGVFSLFWGKGFPFERPWSVVDRSLVKVAPTDYCKLYYTPTAPRAFSEQIPPGGHGESAPPGFCIKDRPSQPKRDVKNEMRKKREMGGNEM